MARDPNRRIVCLTEEPTEILYLLGEQHRIVGISAYTERPPEAKRDKPVVSAFTGGSVPKILACEPDLVIGFSDIQADLAKDLVAAGLQVVIFNQRSLEQILDVIVSIGWLVGAHDRANALAADLEARLDAARARTAARTHRPRVYFEEWPDPTITAIQWVSELIAIAGGEPVYGHLAEGAMARDRIVDPADVIVRAPEVVIASWCGKPFDRGSFEARPGYGAIPAVRDGRVYEMDPAIILQPGPACILAGLPELERLLHGDPPA
ncbi:MAG: ABC transporter substrate-binding protein [Myxococcota bacterium]